jgi:hypothetical protein
MGKEVVVKTVNGVQVITVENQALPDPTQNIPEPPPMTKTDFIQTLPKTILPIKPSEKRYGFTEASGWITAAVLAGVLIATLLLIWLF